jgi:hypothetical protein
VRVVDRAEGKPIDAAEGYRLAVQTDDEPSCAPRQVARSTW